MLNIFIDLVCLISVRKFLFCFNMSHMKTFYCLRMIHKLAWLYEILTNPCIGNGILVLQPANDKLYTKIVI